MSAARFDGWSQWIDALLARHTAALSRTEFLKAARALSARYVERRHELTSRSPIDSAGKRAAFAALYAPLHALAAEAVVRELGTGATGVQQILDLGCGTGAASAGWAVACDDARPRLSGIDRDVWALGEVAWNWRTLGLAGRTTRQDLVAAAKAAPGSPRLRDAAGSGVVLGWAVNEIDDASRGALRDALRILHQRGAAILVLEPLATRASPWWNDWVGAFSDTAIGTRGDVWTFDDAIPAVLAEWREAAGFRRSTLDVRSLWIPAPPPGSGTRGTMRL